MRDIIQQLKKDILLMQGFKAPTAGAVDVGLGPLEDAFPNGVFPMGGIHEFLTQGPETAASSEGFIAGIMASLMLNGGPAVWISASRKVFPPGLVNFNIRPDQVIFVDVHKEKEVLWVMEESLKCKGISCVVGEVRDVSFPLSRRLQLAVEQRQSTGFLLRHQPRNTNPIAAVARWKIQPLSSKPEDSLPGLGYPRWSVELERIRNGQPGTWQLEWSAGRFHALPKVAEPRTVGLQLLEQKRKTG